MPLKKRFAYLKKFDWILFISAILLVCFGLIAIYSISLGKGDELSLLNFKKQLIFAVVGVCLLFLFSFLDYKILKPYSYILYVLILILLGLVLVFGREARGMTGWFTFSGINFQPVEIAKLVLIIFLANYIGTNIRATRQIWLVLVSGLTSLVMFLLVVFQPDLSSALVLFFLWFGTLLIAGLKRGYIFLILFLITLIIIGSWFFILKDYQKSRLLTFLNPGLDPLGQGYNVTQATIAVGSGKIFGWGLGLGSQSQLKFLPEAQTDFIFAAVAEELGFLGCFLLFLLWGVLFYRIIRIAKFTKDDFSLFLVLGILILFFSQVFINIGMNIGMVPVAGISLPLVSYGGSFLIVGLVMVGILESIAIRNG